MDVSSSSQDSSHRIFWKTLWQMQLPKKSRIFYEGFVTIVYPPIATFPTVTYFFRSVISVMRLLRTFFMFCVTVHAFPRSGHIILIRTWSYWTHSRFDIVVWAIMQLHDPIILFRFVLDWGVWKFWNLKILQQRDVSIFDVAGNCFAYAESFQEIQKCQKVHKHLSSLCWKPPPCGK